MLGYLTFSQSDHVAWSSYKAGERSEESLATFFCGPTAYRLRR
jgi:hypothetical protein